MRFAPPHLLVLILAALLACDAGQVENRIRNRISTLSREYRQSEVVVLAEQLADAVQACDTQQLKHLCSEVGGVEYRAVMGCYYNAFVMENERDVEAVATYLDAELERPGAAPGTVKAVQVLREYFRAKGSLRTKEVAALVLIIGLEAQYPHCGGIIGSAISMKLGLMDAPRSDAAPEGAGGAPAAEPTHQDSGALPAGKPAEPPPEPRPASEAAR